MLSRPRLLLAAGATVVLALAAFAYGFYLGRERFDVVLRGGYIVDGTGSEPRRADVGVRDGRIREIGSLRGARADEVVDVSGLFIMPGFIDTHTHIEPSLSSWTVRAPNFARQGVTTVITGNCGTSMVRVEDLFDSRRRFEVNVATLIGHESVRLKTVGKVLRRANAQEITAMQAQVRDAMREGALGFSTGLAYAIGGAADENELGSLVAIAAEYGGVYATHIRDEASGSDDAVEEAIRLARASGAPVMISHMKLSGPRQWGRAAQRIRQLHDAIAQGTELVFDQYPYNYSSTSLDLLFSPDDISTGRLRFLARSAVGREQVRENILENIRRNGWADLGFARVAWYDQDHSLEGRTIAEICASEHLRPCTAGEQADTAIEIRLKGSAQMLYHDMSIFDVNAFAEYKDGMVGSDSRVRTDGEVGRPHPRGSGTFPKFLFDFVRNGDISWGEAARRMSGLPAQFFGLAGRGTIQVGSFADLVVVNPNEVHDTATLLEPLQQPKGIVYVFVNGVAVVRNGMETQQFPGKALRRQGVSSTPTLALTLRPTALAGANGALK